MSTALERPRAAAIDVSTPVFWGVGVFLFLLVAIPLSWIVVTSFLSPQGTFTLANYAQLVSNPEMVKPFAITMLISTCVAIACVAVALPMGWFCARTDMPLRRLVRVLVTASFVTPPFLGAIAWEILAAPNTGMINTWWRGMFGLDRSVHIVNLYSVAGLTFVNALYTFPFVFVLVTNALERLPAEVEEASEILGGSWFETLRRITLPLVAPAIAAGAIVSFLQSTTVFGSAAIITLPANFHTMTTKIWSLFQFPAKPGLAAAASLPLLLLTVALLQAQRLVLGRRGYAVVGGKAARRARKRLGVWNAAALAYCAVILGLSIVLPYFALVKAAFTKIVTDPFGGDNLTLAHVHFVFFELDSTRGALVNTLVLGVLAATIGVVLATIVAYASVRRSIPGAKYLGLLATAPLAIPSIVLGVGLFLAYTRPPLVLYGTLWILLLAYLTIELPVAYQQLESAIRNIHPELEEASRLLGADRLRALRDVTVPLLRTGIVAAWCFVFIGAIREISAAIMLFTAKTNVVSVVIYDLNESGDIGNIAVLGITLLLVTFAVVVVANRFGGSAREMRG